MSRVLGTARHPVVGLAPTRSRPCADHRIPSHSLINTAYNAWRRRQPIGGAAYYDQLPTSPRNPNPRNE